MYSWLLAQTFIIWSISEAEPYLMNDARIQTWAALYDRGVNSLTSSDDSSEYTGSLSITTA